MSGVGAGRAEIHPQDQDAVFDLGHGVADDGEVLVVVLGLLEKPLPLLPSHRWEGALPHGRSPGAEALDHGIDIERITHRQGG